MYFINDQPFHLGYIINLSFFFLFCSNYTQPFHFLKSKKKCNEIIRSLFFFHECVQFGPCFPFFRGNDSSGFEHVFVGETRGDKEVIGFHNWIQFYLQEKLGTVDYKGFMASDRVSVNKKKSGENFVSKYFLYNIINTL